MPWRKRRTLSESESSGAKLNCRHSGGFYENVALSWPKSKVRGTYSKVRKYHAMWSDGEKVHSEDRKHTFESITHLDRSRLSKVWRSRAVEGGRWDWYTRMRRGQEGKGTFWQTLAFIFYGYYWWDTLERFQLVVARKFTWGWGTVVSGRQVWSY